MTALNNVVWGAFYSCFLGCKLDVELINRGYMTTAVQAVTEFAFRRLHLHRIEGNIMPKNKPSLRVLEKCGYQNEGLSKSYLKINGRWEDHIHMVKLNFEEDNQRIVRIQEHPELVNQAVAWFHQKWNVPEEAYLESMEDCVQNKASVPQWYVVLDGETIIGGLGVIENDFHDRKDLTPNVCAVYVEEPYRNQGLAGKMLQFAAEDMRSKGIDTLYLVTDHTSFYERYGWNFLCMVQGDGEPDQTRMYIHKS